MPSNNMERKYFLEKLDESNYKMWKIKMEFTLTRMNIMDIVNGDLRKPTIEEIVMHILNVILIHTSF